MNLVENVSFLDMDILDMDFEEKPKRRNRMTTVNLDTETIRQMQKADKNQMRTCFECGKVFCSRIQSGAQWPYKDKYMGKQRWYCSWTCLCRNRKGRKL